MSRSEHTRPENAHLQEGWPRAGVWGYGDFRRVPPFPGKKGSLHLNCLFKQPGLRQTPAPRENPLQPLLGVPPEQHFTLCSHLSWGTRAACASPWEGSVGAPVCVQCCLCSDLSLGEIMATGRLSAESCDPS